MDKINAISSLIISSGQN